MADTNTSAVISRKLAVTCILVASYLPPIIGLVLGIGHCDACRQAWLTFVLIVQGALISMFATSYFHFPRIDGGVLLVIPIMIQIGWLVGWTWLAKAGKSCLIFSTATALALTIWFTFVINALIRS